MKKLFVIPFLFFMSFGFTSCHDDEEPIYYFWDEPALVETLGSEGPLIKTPHGKFTAPNLAEKGINEGDVLWTNFYVDMDKQENRDSLVATVFRYIKLKEEKAKLPQTAETFKELLNDDYTEPFHLAELYNVYIDRYLFFGFYHNGKDKRCTYEIVCNPEIEAFNGHPTLYIRAKEDNSLIYMEDAKIGRTIAAFDMTEFLDKYGVTISGGAKAVKFNLKYKIGTNNEGKDIYREFISNPITWSAR
jgi:hypothetical protein